MDKSLVFGTNATDNSFDYVFDFSVGKGYVRAITGETGSIAIFDLNPVNIAKAAFTGEWVESDEEGEIDESAQIVNIHDMWIEALNSVTDVETDMTATKAHIGMIALILGVVYIPAFSATSVAKIVKSVKSGNMSPTDAYQDITDGMGYDIVK